MPALADLIQARMDNDQVSSRALARESEGRLEHQTIDKWRNRAMIQFPRDAEVFEAFADILHTSVEQVVLAMAAQLGVPVRSISSSPPVPGLEVLTGPQLGALRALVRSIAASSEQSDSTLRIAADERPKAPRSPRSEERK